MSAIGPTEHRQFCQIDGWQQPEGTNHDKWEKRLPDSRLLRTVVSRNKNEYGQHLKSSVLKQLEVDETSFWRVINTGEPAERPTPKAEPERQPLPGWAVATLMKNHLSESEIARFDAEEAIDLANYSFTLPTTLSAEALRAALLSRLSDYRDDP